MPPPYMRYCGPAFRDDATFLESGQQEARRLVVDFGMSDETRLLEIGCGPGRLPIGIIAERCSVAEYHGVDIDAASIDWCRKRITARHPNFHFQLVDAHHDRYNPDGRHMAEGFRLPFSDASFDLIYLHSVFANMLEDDIRVYCGEFFRVLRPMGRVFLTAFVEDDVPNLTVDPDDYVVSIEGRLNVARYETRYFLNMLCEPGFEIDRFSHGTELGGQSEIHLVKS